MKKLSINLPTAMLATVLSMSLTSCETLSYQVYEVKSPDLIQRENSLVFENEDCKVSYNLWEYNGSMKREHISQNLKRRISLSICLRRFS